MPEIKFAVNDQIFLKWQREAMAVGLGIGPWVRMRLLSLDPVPKPDPVPIPKPDLARRDGLIGDRLLVALNGRDRLDKAEIPAMAEQLGVSTRSLYAAVGSLVAAGRMRRKKLTYLVVDMTRPTE
jgi:hypothetical protein